jgi:diguanylate cyclase (GGDEF)-like protein
MTDENAKRILVVDDDPIILKILAAELRAANYRVITANSAEDALELLDLVRPDAVLSDVMMPGLSGVDLLAQLKSRAEISGIPLLLMSSGGAAEERAAAIRLGACDYMQKPVAGLEVVARLNRRLEQADELSKLRRLSEVDALTGLSNRRGITSALDRALGKSRTSQTDLSVVLLDVDNFKHVNDTHGHKEGDALLRQIASLLRRTIREHDLAGRIGGDEFVLVLPDCSHLAAMQLGGRIERAMTELAERYQARVGLSHGVYCASGGASAEQVLDAADKAMYAKKLSRPGRSNSQTLSHNETPVSM